MKDLVALIRELQARLPEMVDFVQLHAAYCENVCGGSPPIPHTPRCKMLCEQYGLEPVPKKAGMASTGGQ